MKDMKEALGSARKPDITHVRKAMMNYIARPCEYGSAKYERANFLRPASAGRMPEHVHIRADFERFRAYLRASLSHLVETLDAMEKHQSQDPHLEDVDGMRRAAFAEDTDAKPGCKVGASGLPHVAHAAASLNMAITQATEYGLLPEDPGTPWENRSNVVITCERVGRITQGLGNPLIIGISALLDEQPEFVREPTRPMSAAAAAEPATAAPAPEPLFTQCASRIPGGGVQCALSRSHTGRCQNEANTLGWCHEGTRWPDKPETD